jgi:hypothetical protein
METIDDKKVKQITSILSGDKSVNLEPIPGLEPHVEPTPPRWLYFFNARYLYIENIHLKPLTEFKTDSEAEALLKKYPTKEEMMVTAAFLPDQEKTLPDLLKNHSDVRVLTVSDSATLANHIYMTSLVPIDPKTLDKTKFLTLGKRVSDFIADRKKTSEIAARLRANSRKNIR